MTPSLNMMRQILDSPAAHFKLQAAVRAFMDADPVDALHDAARLVELMRLRLADVQADNR